MRQISNLVLVLEVPYIFLFFFGSRRLATLNFLLFFALQFVVMNLLKQIFNAPRPYMIDFTDGVGVQAFDRSTGCGHPSGHSETAAFMLLVLAEDLGRFGLTPIRRLYCNVPAGDEEGAPGDLEACLVGGGLKAPTRTNYEKNVLAFIGFLVFQVMVSRMYLGMHSLDQVIYGLAWGLFLHFLYRVYFEELFRRLILLVLYKRQRYDVDFLLPWIFAIMVFQGLIGGVNVAVYGVHTSPPYPAGQQGPYP